jgi:multiple sugar transport system substrate-binding protein
MARRILFASAVALAGVLAVSLAACSSDGTTPANSGTAAKLSSTVNFWVNPLLGDAEAASWKPTVEAFEKANPGVTINITVQPWLNRDEKLSTSIAGGVGPDVVYLNDFQLPNYVDQGAVADVTPGVSPDKKLYSPSVLSGITFVGKIYGYPALTTVTSLVYNKDVMAAAGIAEADYPKTFDQIMAVAPKIKASGNYVTEYEAYPSAPANLNFYPFLWSAGGDVLNRDQSKATLNTSQAKKALTFLKQLADGGYLPKNSFTAVQQNELSPVARGKTALTFAKPTSELTGLRIKESDLVVGPPLTDTRPAGYGTVGTFAVLEGSKNKDAANAWAKFITRPDQLSGYLTARGLYSPLTSQKDLYPATSLAGQQGAYVDDMFHGVLNKASGHIETIVDRHVQAALLGSESVSDALRMMNSEVNAVVARG